MIARARSCFAFALVATGAMIIAPLARAEVVEAPAEQASQSFARGRERYDAQRFDEALVLFRAALELAPSPNARLYVGRCLRRLGRLAEAYNELRRAAQEADRRANTEPRYAATRESAREEASAIVSSVAFVTLTVSNAPAGAEVTIDGQRTGPALWGSPLARAPGRSRIEARAEGMQPIAVDVELRAGAETRVRIPFSPENLQNSVQIGFGNDPPANTASQSVETVDVDRGALDASMGARSARPDSRGSTPAIAPVRPANSAWVPVGGVAVGLGLAGVINGIVFAVFAEQRYQALRTMCERSGADCRTDPAARAQINEGRMFDAITIASVGGGVALAAVGVGMVIGGVLQNENNRAAQQRPVAPAMVRLTPSVTPTRAGVTLGIGGTF